MQPITITAFFTNNNIPIETLTPTIRIRKTINGNLVITDALMISIGEGQYAYDFINTEANTTYTIVCDGGIELPNAERYSYASCETLPVELVASFSE
jgi:hypothetical protein